MIFRTLGVGAVLAAATPVIAIPAMADDLCADRPGLGTPACVVDRGHVVVETGLADWTRDRQDGSRTDSVVLGDTLLRVGLTDSLEAQVGWTVLGYSHDRNTASGEASGQWRTGDVTLALRQNLRNPDGSGFSIAVMPYATLPAGREPVGAGDWGTGLALPMSLDLGAVSLSLTPSVDAAVDGDGKGRHLGFGTVAGIGFDLTDTLSVTQEISIYRDDDPDRHATRLLAGLSLAWQPTGDSQWDIGANLGLNRDSPDVELYLGYARRF